MIPKNRNSIGTNLSSTELDEICAAIEQYRVDWNKEKSFVFAEFASGEFEFAGNRYAVDEYAECVTRIYKI